jgi:hypothetical protein
MMKSNLVLSVVLALAALPGCSAPSRGNGSSPTGGVTSSGGGPTTSGSGGDSTGAGNGGSASSGGAVGQGGSSNNSSSGVGGSGDSGGANPGGATAKGGSGAGGANPGGSTAKGGSGAGGANLGGTSALSSGGVLGGNSAGSAGSTTVTGGRGGGGSVGTGGSVGSGGSTGAAGQTGTGTAPCDLYQAANTPCGAGHSTVRALYSAYTGPLYQLQRASDKTTKDVMVGSGGFADTTVQTSFCSGTTCTIPLIYDQSPNGNHLRVTWWGYWMQNGGNPADANAAKITVGGHTVYGIRVGGAVKDVGYRTGVALAGTASVTKGSTTVTFSTPQTLPANTILIFTIQAKDCVPDSWPNNCKVARNFTSAAITAATTVTLKAAYQGTSSTSTVARNETTFGIAIDDEAEAMYSVFDGKIYSNWCCTDYGNAEMTGIDEGHATMEALYWGADTQFGQSGGGSGPWVAADLEDGMYEGYENGSMKVASNTSITGFPYVTGMLKGLSAKDCPSGLTSSGCFALKAGNSTSGKLEWKFSATTKNYGARPPGYSPQKKQGAIILATGGDSSNTGNGIWFEGAIAKGAVPDATDDAIQANIVAAGYGK